MQAKTEFVQRFEDAWKEPRTRFPALFNDKGTLFQSGMERPIEKAEIPAHQEVTLRLIPDLRITPTHWAEQGSDVLIEWDAQGSFNGKPLNWSGASRFTLRDGLVDEEVAYFDTLHLRAAIDPSLASQSIVAEALAAQESGEA